MYRWQTGQMAPHVLAGRRFTLSGVVFPASSVVLDRIDDYRETLQAHSRPLTGFIEWRPAPERNVEVLNDPADLYCYFDAREGAKLLYACVMRTVERDLLREIDYLRRHDEALRCIIDMVEMPDRLAEDLVMFIRQNRAKFPKKRRLRGGSLPSNPRRYRPIGIRGPGENECSA